MNLLIKMVFFIFLFFTYVRWKKYYFFLLGSRECFSFFFYCCDQYYREVSFAFFSVMGNTIEERGDPIKGLNSGVSD